MFSIQSFIFIEDLLAQIFQDYTSSDTIVVFIPDISMIARWLLLMVDN
jgi:hypothetical protein